MFTDLSALVLKILREEGLPEIEPVFRDIPFSGRLGIAISNVFQIARQAFPDVDKAGLKAKVDSIARTIAERLGSTGEFEKVESENGYVNCFLNVCKYATSLVGKIFAEGVDWAHGEPGGEKVMIEYSQPNTHKAFHIGHVRCVVIGATLVRCFRYAGRDTVAANYIGDSGAHIFKALWYLEKHAGGTSGAPKNPAERGVWLGEAYAKADALLSESEELKNQAWEILKPLSVELEELWRDDGLVGPLKVDELARKVALKEIDLFENRAATQVAAIIKELCRASILIYGAGVDKGIIKSGSHAACLVESLLALLGKEGFEEIWGRDLEVLEIADRWAREDPVLLALWLETRQWSLDDFDRIYAELGAPFDEDAIFFESEVEKEGGEIAADLEREGIVTESKGAKIVEIDKRLHERFGEPERDKYRVMVLLRSDGTSLYAAKDLALARKKFRDYKIQESIYVVAIDQKFYFEQVFQVLRLMGFPQWEKCYHLPYELVMLPGGKMSSRKGHVVLYDEVMRELVERAMAVVNEKNPGLTDEARQEVAREVARGALLYGMLRVDTNKKINFDFDEVLDFDGRSAPYIQYAGARASSILRKAKGEGFEPSPSPLESDFNVQMLPVEIDLIGLVGKLPKIVEKVVEDKKPILLASYAYDLAVAFSEFYHQCPVLTATPEVRNARLLIVKAVRITLDAALSLLGISSPEVM